MGHNVGSSTHVATTGDSTDLQSTLLPHSEVLLTEELADTLRTSEAGTDLRMDWTDDVSLGFDGEQYFLVVVDKDTEHVVTFNTKTRSDPVDLLANYFTITKCVHTIQARVEGGIDLTEMDYYLPLTLAYSLLL